MKSTFVKDFVTPAAVLTIICIIVSALLAGTYGITKPVIDAAEQAKADASRAIVLEGAGSFTKLDATPYENVSEIYKEDSGLGYVITCQAKGYGGVMNIMVGIKSDGTISRINTLSHGETQGFGSNVVGDQTYLDKYVGKDSNLEVDNYSGATVSSKALKSALTAAYKAYGGVAGVEIADAAVDPKEAIFPEGKFSEFTLEGADKAFAVEGGGYILVTSDTGYDGNKIEVYTGFGSDWKIAGVALGENNETPGIGSNVGETEYTSQYVGKDSVDGITAVSGATFSSDGFKNSVAKAIELLPALQDYDLKLNAEFFPEAAEFTVLEEAYEGADSVVKCGDLGYVFTVTTDGYGGAFTLKVGISADGKISLVKVAQSHETAGFGLKLSEPDHLATWQGKADGETADGIAGATVTSEAFSALIKRSFRIFNEIKEVA